MVARPGLLIRLPSPNAVIERVAGDHKGRPYRLALPLFMLRVFTTNDHHHAIAPNHLTVLAARLDRCAYFHNVPSSVYRNLLGRVECRKQ
jgi:hypothetical protein